VKIWPNWQRGLKAWIHALCVRIYHTENPRNPNEDAIFLHSIITIDLLSHDTKKFPIENHSKNHFTLKNMFHLFWPLKSFDMWEIHIKEKHLELHVIKWFIILLIQLWVCQVILMTNSQILITIEILKF